MHKILIIDDDVDFGEALKTVVSAQGYDVTLCSDSEKAMGLIEQGYDLVITDIIMPSVGGMEIISDIKASNHACRVIAVSGGGRVAGKHYLPGAEALGADATLEKPFKMEELKTIISKLLS